MRRNSGNNAEISAIATPTIQEMQDAILRSGYALEQRIEPVFAKEGFFVDLNPVFPDSDTGKSREYDLSAITAYEVYKKTLNFLFAVIPCQCINNTVPLVFFVRDSPIAFLHHQEVKISGIPVKFWNKDGFVGLSEFVGMKNYWHYCKGKMATQYCTFQVKKDKSAWMALHAEEHYLSLDALMKATEYEMDHHFRSWTPPDEGKDEDVNIQIYFPLLIVQGDIYAASVTKHGMGLKKENHIQFRKEMLIPRTGEIDTYQIDIITERHLRKYLTVVNLEMEKVKMFLQRRRAKVQESISRIVSDARAIEKDINSYRETLEF